MPARPGPSRVVGQLEYTSFSYIYKVVSEKGTEMPRRYTPFWGYDWYLVSSRPFLTSRPGRDVPPVPERDYIGWLPAEHVLVWNTREALEPAVGRSRDAHVFQRSSDALAYTLDPGKHDRALLKDMTPPDRTWMGQRFRYPVLGQPPQTEGQAAARLIAHQGNVRFAGGSSAKGKLARQYGELDSALHRLRSALAQPKVIFIFDGTQSMCPYIEATIEAADRIVAAVRRKGISLEMGAVVYKDQADDFQETQVFAPGPDTAALLAKLRALGCRQEPDGDFEESLFKGVYDAWDKALRRQDDAFVTYVLMGDAGSSAKEQIRADAVAAALSGYDPGDGGGLNLYAFHGLRILHPTRNPAERTAMEKFEDDVKGALIAAMERIENPLLVDFDEQGPSLSPHSYHHVDVRSAADREEVALQAAGKIETMIRRLKIMEESALDMLQQGKALGSVASSGASSADEPVATAMMERFLNSVIGEDGVRLAREQRSQIFYRGWVATHDLDGSEIMSPVLFLTRRETSQLLDTAIRVQEESDCESVKAYFRDLIGAVAPEDEQLPIHVLIRKKKGILFRSALLQAPYLEIDSLCSDLKRSQFEELLESFRKLEQFLFTMTTAPEGTAQDVRRYELVSGDFYWVPVGRLP